MINKKLLIIIIILTILGIINASYLSYEAYHILHATNTSALLGTSFCDINDTLSCTSFMNKPESRIFGIPFPYIALCVYPILCILSILAYVRNNITLVKIVTILAFMGLAFNWFVISREFSVGVFCPLCLMCTGYILTIGILGSIILKQYSQASNINPETISNANPTL